jgi:hypothetical protein
MEFFENGQVQFEKMSTIIIDTTDGYLSNVNGVEYQSGTPEHISSLLQLAGGPQDSDDVTDANEIGGQLLSILSQIHDILMEKYIHEKDEQFVMDRLTKFTGLAQKLSEAYAQTDPYYENNFHNDIVIICETLEENA